MKKAFLITIILLLLVLFSFTQDNTSDIAALMSKLKNTSDKTEIFKLLCQLGTYKYKEALPYSDYFLQSPPNFQGAWQIYFIYGIYGHSASEYLLTKINNNNFNVRYNAIWLLGSWILEAGFEEQIKQMFWDEKPELKMLMILCFKDVAASISSIASFMDEIIEKEQDTEILRLANSTVKKINSMESKLNEYKSLKNVNADLFDKEYQLLFDSFGKDGNISNLGIYSDYSYESKLNSLREKIIQRFSDECVYEYFNINKIIIYNRWLK